MANWTNAQQNAIDSRKGTVLVSAAAGSGKTAVLVERVMERLCDPEHPTDADRLLIVTFTKAAAAEMKSRIALRLSAMLEQSPGNKQLKRQKVLLQRANISTIHSFCSRIVKEFFYKLNISPEFTIGDDSQLSLFRREAVEAALEEGYASGGEAFYRLAEVFGSDKDDKRLSDTILRVYDFTCAHPFPKQWMAQTEALYHSDTPIEQTVWGKLLLTYIKEALIHCIHLTKTAMNLLDTEETLQKAYLPALESDCGMLQAILSLCDTGTWNQIMQGVAGRTFARLGTAKGYKDDPLALQVKSLRQQVKDTFEKKLLPKLFSETDCKEDLAQQALLIGELFRLVQSFTTHLEEIKRKKRTADFSDLERWALQLLYEEQDGEYVTTPEAELIRQRFDEIIVDEYQDTNEAQDRIFRAVSKNEENLFLVGDVKQSIYGFRQAMPQLFLGRREAYEDYCRGEEVYPAKIILDRNFRSRQTVTDTVNYLFRQLMTKDSADVDYEGGEELVAGAVYPEQKGAETELVILRGDSVQDETLDEDMAVLEAREIAGQIHRMMGEGFLVTEKGIQRPAAFGDFTILLRSANNHMAKYVQELQQNGIPAKAGRQPGFFRTGEVAVMVSLLRIISNPMQDIPLASVLMSPLYGFAPDDMTKLRLCDKDSSLYLALRKSAEQGMALSQKVLWDLEAYRTVSATMTADRMLRYLYETTGFCDLVQSMEGGQRRLSNLHLLLDYARQYEAAGYHGISGFVRFIDRLEKEKGELPAAESMEDGDNAVTVMSIHNSKGLEFPVCFLAGCSRRFHKLQEEALIHPKYGLGVKLRMADTLCKYTTMMREAISIALSKEDMAEELRVFYVALTRAKEKLILVTTEKKLPDRLSSLAAGLGEEERLDSYVVANANSFSDWILTCMLRHPDGQALRELSGVDVPVLRGESIPTMTVRFALPQPPWEQEAEEQAEPPQPDLELAERLRRQITFVYPYEALETLPAKVTASALAEEQSAKDRPMPTTLRRPSFLYEKGLTPAERGTATHAFLQFCDFSAAKEHLSEEKERLVQQGFLSAEQGKAVDEQRAAAFLNSDLCRRMTASPNCCREYRFTAEIPAYLVEESLKASFPEQTVVLQGAVDCVFEEDGALVLVDYKTDYVPEKAALWQRYERQLSLYAMAMEQCFGLPVKERLLYAFSISDTVTESD